MSHNETSVRPQLLVVDDDSEWLTDLARYLTSRGCIVQSCVNGEQAVAHADQSDFDVAILDLAMPGMSGIEVLQHLKERNSELEAIVLTGHGSVESAVDAMKLGAGDFLTKPVSLREIDRVVRKAYEKCRLQRANQHLATALRQQRRSPRIVGESKVMQEVYRLIRRTAPSIQPVLIQGDSGTGKELVAHAIHEASPVSDQPFVVVNCAALPETLLESELFGHEKGAFTGAMSAKPGLFEVADGGTLFIDEIGELAGPLQAKLLRVLEDGHLRRVGSVKERRVNVRLIAATNRDLLHEVDQGRFREDLYYRINVLTIYLPRLCERAGDLELLLDYFLGHEWQVDEDAATVLFNYPWPGNVRQLSNALQRAKLLAEDDRIRVCNLPPEIVGSAKDVMPLYRRDLDLESVTRLHIEATFNRCGRNKVRTARALGVGRRTLYRLLERHAIDATPVNCHANRALVSHAGDVLCSGNQADSRGHSLGVAPPTRE